MPPLPVTKRGWGVGSGLEVVEPLPPVGTAQPEASSLSAKCLVVIANTVRVTQ